MTPIQVVLRDGDDASGMATMLGGLLEDNLRDFKSRARVARVLRGPVVMTASDRNMSVTIDFKPGVIELRDGAQPDATGVAGPWLAMTKLCSGQQSPVAAFRSGDVKITGYRGAPIAAGAGFVMSVPASFYEEELAKRPGGTDGPTSTPTSPLANRKVQIAIVVAVAVLAAYVVTRRRRMARVDGIVTSGGVVIVPGDPHAVSGQGRHRPSRGRAG